MDGAIRPFLRWAGSKRQLVPELKAYWNPGFSRYVEPFMGSACLFFALRPHHALLNDLNPELVETFSAVRDHPQEVAKGLSKLSRSHEIYYDLRRQDPSTLDAVNKAVKFVYLNRYCFNGLYRTDRQGHFNVPFSKGRTGQMPIENELQNISLLLQNAELFCSAFEEIVSERVRPADFVHMDPPYAVSDRRVFKQYSRQPFAAEDLHRLRQALHTIEERGAFFVLSYASCDKVLNAFLRLMDTKFP